MYSSSKLNLGAFNTVSSHANVPPQSKHKQTIHYILNVDIFTVYFLGKISKKLSKIHINGVLTTLLLYMQISLSLIGMPLSKTFHLSY